MPALGNANAPAGRKRAIIDLDSSDVEQPFPPPAAKKIKERPDPPSATKEDQRSILEQIDAVELEDETVYDNCQQVRKKISDFLATKQCTQADFLRALGGVNSNSLRVFLGYKGPVQGSGSRVYDSAYVFFEKLRILNGKPKTAARKKAEAELGGKGFSTETGRGGVWLKEGESVSVDPLGRFVYSSRG